MKYALALTGIIAMVMALELSTNFDFLHFHVMERRTGCPLVRKFVCKWSFVYKWKRGVVKGEVDTPTVVYKWRIGVVKGGVNAPTVVYKWKREVDKGVG